jgi:hypothetical protein
VSLTATPSEKLSTEKLSQDAHGRRAVPKHTPRLATILRQAPAVDAKALDSTDRRGHKTFLPTKRGEGDRASANWLPGFLRSNLLPESDLHLPIMPREN